MTQPITFYRLEPVEMRQLRDCLAVLQREVPRLPTHCVVGLGGANPLCAVRLHPNSDLAIRRQVTRLQHLLARIALSAVREAQEEPDTPPSR